MTKIIPEKRARQGGVGSHGFMILIGALLLTAIAWAIAETYGEQAKTPATQQSEAPAASGTSANPDDDPMQSKTDTVNGEPVDQNPKVDKNPTP